MGGGYFLVKGTSITGQNPRSGIPGHLPEKAVRDLVKSQASVT